MVGHRETRKSQAALLKHPCNVLDKVSYDDSRLHLSRRTVESRDWSRRLVALLLQLLTAARKYYLAQIAHQSCLQHVVQNITHSIHELAGRT